MSLPDTGALVFVIGVSSFTKRGFLGSTSFGGQPLEIEFDDQDDGIFLSPEMCTRIDVRKGSKVTVAVEGEDRPVVSEATIAGVTSKPRLSNAKVYYEVGRGGGAVLAIRKA